ncbi:hypothetical protein LJB99_03455 [Deltaproteobacteria bacterium OttesenSCG-928-K17]|nr:hypothetical protein [Deltaproteobacteria bacterium OttesenSCG-928-K17]
MCEIGRPIIRLQNVRLKDRAGLPSHGPLSLSLAPGQSALVLAPDLDVLRRLMKYCLGLESPAGGQIDWWGDCGPQHDQHWKLYDFYRQIGHIDRQSQLLGQASLNQQFHLLRLYSGQEELLNNNYKIFELFSLTGYLDLASDDLPEPQRRLALYALAFCKSPRLMLMERPAQFLDHDFDLVWRQVLSRAEKEKMAYIVFDRTEAPYSDEKFDFKLNLTHA